MTVTDIDPAVVAQIRERAERVVVKTDTGYRSGVRSREIFALYNYIGCMTITDDGEVYHGMLGSRPTFNRTELAAEIARMQKETSLVVAALQELL